MQLEAQDLAQAVIARMADCKEPRLKEVMTSLIKHAHAFVQDVQLTPDEWMAGIQFLTAAGQMCDEKRQEFILLSDTLGISMLVVAIEQAKAAAAFKPEAGADRPTEATVLGPFFWEGAPELALGSDLSIGQPGEPTYYHGRVTDTVGKPIANCQLDVWSGDAEGFYDLQKGPDAPMALRARFHTDAWSGRICPVHAQRRHGGKYDAPPGASPQPPRPHAHLAPIAESREPDHPPVRVRQPLH